MRNLQAVRSPWELSFELREWQVKALDSWEQSGRQGVVEAATGTGKTAVAFGAIDRARSRFGSDVRVAVVVPTKALASQWRTEMQSRLGVPRRSIGEQHSAAEIEWQPNHEVLITVINSARNSLLGVLDRWRADGSRVLLVVDECHRAGSESNLAIFDGHFDMALGLSATPERDDGGHQHVYAGLGQPVYRYPLLEALDDGVLAPVTSINLYVDFDAGEQGQWTETGRDLGTAINSLMWQEPDLVNVPDHRFWAAVSRLAEDEVPAAMRVVALVATRRELLSNASARLACQQKLLDWLAETGHRSLVFHETIGAAEASHAHLQSIPVAAGIDHSKLHQNERTKAMDRFRSERSQVLVAVRALDEGIDVPDASVAIIAAGSRSRRQRIQRFGRVLRHAEGKRAVVVSILVRGTPEEPAVGRRDESLVGAHRVRHHRWPGVGISAAVQESRQSSYDPTGSEPDEYSTQDLLTLSEMGLWARGMKAGSRTTPVRSGGYQIRDEVFSINGWHSVVEVVAGSGMPEEAFRTIWAEVRPVYRNGLDPARTKDPDLIHGSEVEAIRRRWKVLRRRGHNYSF